MPERYGRARRRCVERITVDAVERHVNPPSGATWNDSGGTRRTRGSSPDLRLSSRRGPSPRRGALKAGGCYSLPGGDGGGGRKGRRRRAGAQWIGGPPRCCTRIESAMDACADGCLGICTPMASSREGRPGITTARIDSAAAVLRRVVNDSITVGADRAVIEGGVMTSVRRVHLGPQEPGQLSGHGGGHH